MIERIPLPRMSEFLLEEFMIPLNLTTRDVSDCEIAEEISSEVHSGRMKVYPYEQVKRKLELAN